VRRFAAVICLALAPALHAQGLFKWIDESGRVHYGDRLPKGFTGKHERVEGEPPALPSAAPPAAVPAAPLPPRPEARKADPMMDIAARRRATRERLQADVDAASERLEKAREALKSGEAPGDDERQVIQRQQGKGSMPSGGRSNCRDVMGANGRAVKMCPVVIPNEQYYDRMKALEDAVAAATADLDRAREAYRRGVD
jgi:hypothetical protein